MSETTATEDRSTEGRIETHDEARRTLQAAITAIEPASDADELRTLGRVVDFIDRRAGVEKPYSWEQQAAMNIAEWGAQRPETLLLALQEELGELTQAYLEVEHEDGNPERLREELVDLGALCIQLDVVLGEPVPGEKDGDADG